MCLLKWLFVVVVLSFALAGCTAMEKISQVVVDTFAPPTEIPVLRPAEKSLGGIHSIAVADLQGNVGDRAKAVLLEHLDKSQRFKVLNRAGLKYSLEELSFHQSGLVDKHTAKKLGRMLGADALIIGDVNLKYRTENSSTSYTDKHGKRHTTHIKKGVGTLEGAIGLIFLETGEYQAFNNTNSQQIAEVSRTDGTPDAINREVVEQQAINAGVMKFVRLVSPYYDNVKLRFESAETKEGKRGLKYVKAGLWDEGIELLKYEAQQNPRRSGSWYNLGLVMQHRNNFSLAKNALKKCISLNDKNKYIDSLKTLKLRENEYHELQKQFAAVGLTYE